ncbi:MAG: NAD(P)-binding protein [Legionellales bacterium]|nr:NAD(P)-binding protein [Legionellales bacterium]
MEENPVLIVGAGPTGLALALFLKHQGVDVRIIDKDEGPGEASRAMVVQARTLEFYEQLNFAERAIERGTKVGVIDLRKQGKPLASLSLGDLGADLSAFPFALCFPQDHHEQLLIEELARVGVHVERQTVLIDFKEQDDYIDVTLEKNKILESTQTSYLCGCDGASSTVRHVLNIIFPGGTYQERFFVADIVRKDNGMIAADHVNLCMEEASFCAVLPVRQSGTERLIGIVPPHLAQKEQLTFEDIRPSVEKLLGLHVEEMHWFSTYHVHHRVANQFRQGRAFLLGDAAHIHSPAGGQGMNTGIGDAINLAWKLAGVIKKINDPKILDTYETERRAFAMILVKTTDRVFQGV